MITSSHGYWIQYTYLILRIASCEHRGGTNTLYYNLEGNATLFETLLDLHVVVVVVGRGIIY